MANLQEGSGAWNRPKKYYARAYAINDFGTVYSEEEITISTKSEKPNIITFPITLDSIKSDGTVHIGGELQNGGNSAATEWGNLLVFKQ